MARPERAESPDCRVIVVGGHTRSIGKTQLVCDLIAALPEARFIAGKITQYGHGVCAQNGENCGCAPDEHSSAFAWESEATTGTDSARFLAAGARRAFWLRTKQGYLAEGLPLLRKAMRDVAAENDGFCFNLLIESNSLLQFLKPAIYLAVLDPEKRDFKTTAQTFLDRADVLVFRNSFSETAQAWPQVSAKQLQTKQAFLQKENESVPQPLLAMVRDSLTHSPFTRI